VDELLESLALLFGFELELKLKLKALD